jgi:succinate dehydrogenase / fumarate reductase flavoprotein subunit
MQDTMMEEVGIFRNDKGMQIAVNKVAELKERFKHITIDDKGEKFNTDVLEAIELSNLLDTAEITAVCALNRKESRGAHSHEDFPERDDANWMKHTFAYKGPDGKVAIEYKPVSVTKYQPMKRVY